MMPPKSCRKVLAAGYPKGQGHMMIDLEGKEVISDVVIPAEKEPADHYLLVDTVNGIVEYDSADDFVAEAEILSEVDFLDQIEDDDDGDGCWGATVSEAGYQKILAMGYGISHW